MKTNIRFWCYLPQFFLEWNISGSFTEIQNTHFIFDKISFSKVVPFMR